MSRKKGPLIIIGGREEKDEAKDRAILEEVAAAAKKAKGSLVIVTAATTLPEELATEYRGVFKSLGVNKVGVLDIRSREQAYAPETLRNLDDASVLFFTGGDQLRITSQIGDTPIYQRMMEIHNHGGMIAGTSAGAAAVPETMVFSGNGDESSTISAMGMAPGLGLMKGIVIDSHFAERGRFGRLLGAVAQNPKNLGIGIDENTAIIVENETTFRVLGAGAVYVMDGTHISYSSLSDKKPEGVLSICDVVLHVLGEGDQFNLANKRPIPKLDEANSNGASRHRSTATAQPAKHSSNR
jgi:cyanophycinase